MTDNIGLIHDASELRKLIAENPDLPIVVLAGEKANSGDSYWMYCSYVNAIIEEILYIHDPYDGEDAVFTDKDEFEEAVSDALYDKETSDLSDSEFDAMVKAEVAKYEPYWRKVIAVYADN